MGASNVVSTVLTPVLMLLRLVTFALALGLTVISFQAYRQQQTDRLESAFIGFAFLSMGAALSMMGVRLDAWQVAFDIAETIPFIIGFGMLYLSLYR
ncbi:MAG: hypothetical protein ABEJ35_07460 [Halobacteriaceae archaeon]